MSIDPRMAVAGAIVGFVIGLTGMGGGALMTPVLVLLFGVNPATAVSSDVIASLVMKPFGGGIHVRRGTVNWRLVRWLVVGSVPMAFLGSYLIDRVFGGPESADRIKLILGWVLLVAAGAIVAKSAIMARRGTVAASEPMGPGPVRPVPTLLIGAAGGLIVGLTSVGSGSLIIVMLMLLYPMLSAKEMVGSDLLQAIPLVGAAAVGHAIFGSPQVEVIGSVLVGAIPAIMVGAHFSSRGSDRYIKPALFAVLVISSLKLLEPTKGAFNGLVLVMMVATAIGLVAMAITDRRRLLAVVTIAEIDGRPTELVGMVEAPLGGGTHLGHHAEPGVGAEPGAEATTATKR
jgi:uncharacterized membrane protein YfcA